MRRGRPDSPWPRAFVPCAAAPAAAAASLGAAAHAFRGAILAAALALVAVPTLAQPLPAVAQFPADSLPPLTVEPTAGGHTRALRIVRLEFAGLRRTPVALAERAAGLAVPVPASPEAIGAAAERLRDSRLFRSVEVHTRPGEQPGDVVLVFDVRENQPHLRFGFGYEDYSGWYLIPVQLNADNLTGRGEGLTLGARLGYRVAGVELALRRPGRALALDYWELKLRAERRCRRPGACGFSSSGSWSSPSCCRCCRRPSLRASCSDAASTRCSRRGCRRRPARAWR